MKSVKIIMIPVKDRQKSKEFYLKLGFQIIVEAPTGDTTISLAGFQGVICETDNIKIKIKIADLKSKGIEVDKIDETPWGKFAWLKDLDGNGLCLHEK